RCGQDSDCNPSTVAGILGTLYGYDSIPEKWKSPLKSVSDRKFAYTDFTLNSIYELGFKHALQSVEAEGGEVSEEQVTIKSQAVETVKYEKSFENHYPISSTPTNDKLGGNKNGLTAEYKFQG